MKRRDFVISCVVTAGATMISGCGGKERPEGMPPLAAPVKLTIMQGGQPLADAEVQLCKKDLSSGWVIGGRTDAHGVATIFTHGEFDGAPEGEYVALVRKTERTEGTATGPEPTDPSERMKWEDRKNASAKEFSLVNPKYGDILQSDLVVTVSGKTEKTLDVGDAIHIETKLVR